MNKNYKSNNFKSDVMEGLLAEYKDITGVTFKFIVPPTFMSVLQVSSDRHIDFDEEMYEAIRNMPAENGEPRSRTLTYRENIGFVDASEYDHSNRE